LPGISRKRQSQSPGGERFLPPIDKDTELVVHCSVGHRSGLAVSILKRRGFNRLYNMLGGITAWEKLGLPLEEPVEED